MLISDFVNKNDRTSWADLFPPAPLEEQMDKVPRQDLQSVN